MPDGRIEVARVPVTVNRDVDILFVIDDSPGMLGLQTDLKAALPAFVDELAKAEGGLPDLHIGVVTSDVGTMGELDPQPGPSIGSGPGACVGMGKGGDLQTGGTNLLTGTFLSDLQNADGSRARNYRGTLVDTLTTMASVGTHGCGFEQHAAAAKRALAGNPANAGFLRPSANLAVIALADEDDCSIAHSALMSPDTTTLGPLQSFRCTRFGVTCDEGGQTADDMNTPGTKTGCHSNPEPDLVMPIGSYAKFFAGLKQDQRAGVSFAAIVGLPLTVQVELRTPPGGGAAIPALAATCTFDGGGEAADPGVRLAELATSFGPRGLVANACQADLSSPMQAIARQVRSLATDRCLLRDIALPADCVVSDLHDGFERLLPPCGATANGDCYQLVSDPAHCSGQHLELVVNRSAAPSPDTEYSVRCKV
jgi:hypothetical protein